MANIQNSSGINSSISQVTLSNNNTKKTGIGLNGKPTNSSDTDNKEKTSTESNSKTSNPISKILDRFNDNDKKNNGNSRFGNLLNQTKPGEEGGLQRNNSPDAMAQKFGFESPGNNNNLSFNMPGQANQQGNSPSLGSGSISVNATAIASASASVTMKMGSGFSAPSSSGVANEGASESSGGINTVGNNSADRDDRNTERFNDSDKEY